MSIITVQDIIEEAKNETCGVFLKRANNYDYHRVSFINEGRPIMLSKSIVVNANIKDACYQINARFLAEIIAHENNNQEITIVRTKSDESDQQFWYKISMNKTYNSKISLCNEKYEKMLNYKSQLDDGLEKGKSRMIKKVF